MGRLGAEAFAEQVEEGNASLTAALSWHLTSNHYPPHPAFMVPLAQAAVEAGQDEEWDRELDLPLGCKTHKALVAAGADHCTYGETDDDKKDFGACEVEAAVQWRDRTDGKVRAGDVIESFHLESFLG